MKLRLIVALVAFAAFSGSVCAAPTAPVLGQTHSSEISPELLDQIAEAVHCQTGMACCEVRDAYYRGEMEVSKTEDGFVVKLLEADGGSVVIAILEEV